jgi:DNA-binding GntR family transcriptional regulator
MSAPRRRRGSPEWRSRPRPLARRATYDQIADDLRAAILAGEYEPTERATAAIAAYQRERRRLADRLRTLRQETGLSGNRLAKRLGWPQSKVSMIETANRLPTDDDIRQWAAVVDSGDAAAGELLALVEGARAEYATWQDSTRNRLPGARELAARYGVSHKTALRAIQQLIAEGLVHRTGPRLAALVIPRDQRPDRRPMSRRPARVRDRREREPAGLVFGGDVQGHKLHEQVVHSGWSHPPAAAARLLGLDPTAEVWARARHLLVDGRVAERSVSYFPADVARGAPALRLPGPLFALGGVVGVLEGAGYRIARTASEACARLAIAEELAAFGTDPALRPPEGRLVIELTHAAFGPAGEPLEAVVSVRPAAGNVLVFEADEDTPGSAEGHEGQVEGGGHF